METLISELEELRGSHYTALRVYFRCEHCKQMGTTDIQANTDSVRLPLCPECGDGRMEVYFSDWIRE